MLVFLATLLTAATPAPVQVHTLDGTVVSGDLVQLAETGISLETDSGQEALEPTRLQKIVFSGNEPVATEDPHAWVELVDGSVLVVDEYSVDGENARLSLVDNGQIEIDVQKILAVRFKAQDKQQRKQWEEIRAADVRGDRIVIRKDGRVDYLTGVLRDISGESVGFQLDDEVIPVGLAKVEGVIYYHRAADDQPPASLRVSDAYGTELEGTQWRVEDGNLWIRTPAGVELRRQLDQILQIDFSAEKIVYLSDLEPQSIDWQPFVVLKPLTPALRDFYKPRRDQAIGGSPSAGEDNRLQLWTERNGRQTVVSYEKGLALHSRTSMIYKLPADVRQFRALVGIDARVRQQGHVRLVIRGDQRELYAEDVAGSDEPQEVALNVAGIQHLEIFVDFGENLDIGDHLNLCNARFIK